MGGSTPTPQTVQPSQSYYDGLVGSVGLGQSLVNSAVALKPEVRTADIPGMQTTAYRESLINALKSAEAEKALTPDIAATRAELSRQINEDLTQGPSTELSNLWLKLGLADAVATGANTGSGFARSALADKTRSDYFTNRLLTQDRAKTHLADNPQPVVGLDPGALAQAQSQVKSDNISARENYGAQGLSFMGSQAANILGAMQQGNQYKASIDSSNADATNAMRTASANNQNALWGALIGSAGKIGGAFI
jgi:hypothetical protein